MSEPIRLPQGLPDEAYHLGEPLDEFSLGAGRAARKIIFCLLVVVLGLAAVALTFAICASGSFRSVMASLLVLAALIVVGIAIPVGVLRVRGTRVLVCRSGLIYLRTAAEVVRWDDVETLWYEAPRPGDGYLLGYPLFRVRRHSDGREFVFNNFLPRVSSLGYTIEKKTLTHLLAPEIEAFNKGELLQFGPLALSRLGIQRGDDWLYWNAVKVVSFDRGKGQIVISNGDTGPAWHEQSVNDMPNYHIFLETVLSVKS